MEKFRLIQKKWIESKKKIAVLTRAKLKLIAENEKLKKSLKNADKELKGLQNEYDKSRNEVVCLKTEMEKMKANTMKLKTEMERIKDGALELKMEYEQREQQEMQTESINSIEILTGQTRAGSFRANSISVESIPKNLTELEYLKEVNAFNNDGDDDFNETWVLLSENATDEDSEIDSGELKREIDDLMK